MRVKHVSAQSPKDRLGGTKERRRWRDLSKTTGHRRQPLSVSIKATVLKRMDMLCQDNGKEGQRDKQDMALMLHETWRTPVLSSPAERCATLEVRFAPQERLINDQPRIDDTMSLNLHCTHCYSRTGLRASCPAISCSFCLPELVAIANLGYLPYCSSLIAIPLGPHHAAQSFNRLVGLLSSGRPPLFVPGKLLVLISLSS